jgi:hypothetical protein
MASTPPRPQSPHIPLEFPADLRTEYVNLVRISHSPSELVFDFAQLLPGAAAVQVRSRIVMSPLGAKLFFRALQENLTKYEAAYGEIALPLDTSLANQLFHPPSPPENPSP